MYQNEEINQRIRKAQKKLIPSLVFSLIIPLVVVILLRDNYTNDANALAIAGVIPIVRTIALWAWRRRIDWIGLMGAIGFAASFAATVLLGGSSLPLKLYHPIVTGVIGLAFTISAIMRKPLLLSLVRNFKHFDHESFRSPEKQKKITVMTAVIGLVLIGEAIAHIIMAITLPTTTYLVMSRMVTMLMVVILVGVRFIAQRNK